MDKKTVKLFDSELKVMDILWKEGEVQAKQVAEALTKELGWNKNTTYTLIKRCIKKGAIERSEPHFMCRALIPKEDVQEAETDELINKIYDGSVDQLFAALLGRKKLSPKQIERLKQIVAELERGDLHEYTGNEFFRRRLHCCSHNHPGGSNRSSASWSDGGVPRRRHCMTARSWRVSRQLETEGRMRPYIHCFV